MSFPSEAPSSLPPGLKLGVFAGGGPFPRLVAPGIVVDDPAHHICSNPGAGVGTGAIAASTAPPAPAPLLSPSYAQMGLTHVLMRTSRVTQPHLHPHLPADLMRMMTRGSNNNNSDTLQLLLIGEGQTLREVVEFLVRVRVARPHGRILVFGEPFVAAAYLMAIEGRDLGSTWRLVTGDSEALTAREVFREVHGVLNKFARDVEEEGKRVAREEEEEQLRLESEDHTSQSRRKRVKK
jgi:hypothetical protein